jgi:glucokinase
MDQDSYAIGVDLGATKIATALVTRAGEVIESRNSPTEPASGPTAVCDRIASEIKALMHLHPVVGVGIGSPGLVDGMAGVVRGAVNLKWSEVHLAREISHRLNNLAVFIENDANANALGEGFFGSAKGSEHYLLLTIGSGLGSGIVSHGRLITGARSMASDLGHYSIDSENGRPCACGNRGCAETIASGPGLAATARWLIGSRPTGANLKQADDLASDKILSAARAKDEIALKAVAMMARVVGEIGAVASAVIDPDVLVIGGGLGVAAFDLIETNVKREMRRRLPPPQPLPDVRVATLVNSALGAASLVWRYHGLPACGSQNARAGSP